MMVLYVSIYVNVSEACEVLNLFKFAKALEIHNLLEGFGGFWRYWMLSKRYWKSFPNSSG